MLKERMEEPVSPGLFYLPNYSAYSTYCWPLLQYGFHNLHGVSMDAKTMAKYKTIKRLKWQIVSP